jgi:acyl-CoA reductase-like NAD-dependent aldehyde dehydrogenase
VCIAPQRYYVHSRIVEEFTDCVGQLSKGMRLGSGLQASTDVGPLINAAQRERVETMVREAVAQGAEVVAGGARPENMPRGYFYSPTVLTNLQADMRVYRDEIFGPVMPIVPFSDIEEVLKLANSTDYGLAAYVQTNDLKTSIRMYEGLEYGIIAVNDWMPTTPEAPFGGMKGSGMGRECGQEGLYEYLETKAVFIGATP